MYCPFCQQEQQIYIILLFFFKLLDLRKNRLNEVPSEIGELPNLRVLDLEHNQITWLPVYI
jgi:Leucine-rich repeat (LRR) protein